MSDTNTGWPPLNNTRTVTLYDNRTLTEDAPQSIELVVRPDFNGEWMGTVYVDAFPIIQVDYHETSDGDGGHFCWLDIEERESRIVSAWRECVVYFLYFVGEVTEDYRENFMGNLGMGYAETDWFLTCQNQAANEGHGLLEFLEKAWLALIEVRTAE